MTLRTCGMVLELTGQWIELFQIGGFDDKSEFDEAFGSVLRTSVWIRCLRRSWKWLAPSVQAGRGICRWMSRMVR